VGENICQLHIRQKLITRIYRELKKLNSPNKERGKRTKQNFLKRRNSNGQKAHEKCSPSLAIKEMQIKTTIRFHLTPVRIAIISNTTNNRCWRGYGEKGTLLHCWWECKVVQPLWKKF
jgi:hypothetical protein